MYRLATMHFVAYRWTDRQTNKQTTVWWQLCSRPHAAWSVQLAKKRRGVNAPVGSR